MVMEDLKTPPPTYVLKRGRYDMPDTSQKVNPGVPGCLSPMPANAPASRLGLARWLVSAENPLTARVAVNRLWQQHFGIGLVKTAENFGLQSEPPSHPELLDWLATEFVRLGWDQKALHRLIVTSATYRQTSKRTTGVARARSGESPAVPWPALPAAGRARARQRPGDRRIALSPDRRTVRQTLPAGRSLGRACRRRGRRASTFKTGGRISTAAASTSIASAPFRIPAMATFDAPSREICQVKRARTNTPLQALELLNDVTYVEAATHLAKLMMTEGGSTPGGTTDVRLPPRDRQSARRSRAQDRLARPGTISPFLPRAARARDPVDRPRRKPGAQRTRPHRPRRLHRRRQRHLEPGRDHHAGVK